MALGLIFTSIWLIATIIYTVHNVKKNRDVKWYDWICIGLILMLFRIGIDELYDWSRPVTEIHCEQPAELKLGINTVIDEDGNVQSDTVYIYKFNEEIKTRNLSK